MPTLPLFRWSVELIDIQSFFNCSVQRIGAFLSLNQRILLSDAQLPQVGPFWAGIILKSVNIPNPFSILSIKLNTTFTPILYFSEQYQTMLYYIILYHTLLYST